MPGNDRRNIMLDQDNLRAGNDVSFLWGDENLWGISGPCKADETKSI